jgi:hypothetical protein
VAAPGRRAAPGDAPYEERSEPVVEAGKRAMICGTED